MAFRLTPNVRVKRDSMQIVRQLQHLQEPYTAPEGVAARPAALAQAYLMDVAELYQFGADVLHTLAEPVTREPRDEGDRLRRVGERRLGNAVSLGYQQTYRGLPVWEAHVTVRVQDHPLRVTSSESSFHYDVDVREIPDTSRFHPRQQEEVERLIEEMLEAGKGRLVRITSAALMIYRYDPVLRIDPDASEPPRGMAFEGRAPTIPLPEVPPEIQPGRHLVVNEVLFTAALGPWRELHWRALLEIRSGAVVYLRAFVTSAFGNVFRADPVTLTGNTSLTPCSPGTDLDPITDVVTLDGLTAPPAGSDQELTSAYVTLGELSAPTVAPPTAPLPSGDFSFSAVTDDFSAVNCYHHCDGLFRMMEDMGFDLSTYFPDTTFPITVDHRDASLGTVNARGYGNAAGNGAGGMGFNLAQSGCTAGIGADLRVVLHEFCHELLWENVNSPNFGFAHSAGDSLAAILLDPGSQAPNRSLTFPWISTLDARRHDRDVTAGWAWGGSKDDTQYQSEQILSTTLFRLYRSTGGDAPNLNQQRFAARYVSYLIIKGIGLLTATTSDPEVYTNALMDADTGTPDFESIVGGALHKVIRWSFEKQGLYQPAGAPTPVASEGGPPDVDVYIDDGRAGEYRYQRNFWNTQAIWNRLGPAGGSEADHETPVVGTTNYLYVRVKNRGTQDASNVVVQAYHCIPATGLVWPDDWQPTTTAELSVAGSIPAGGDVVVGPFEWTPEVVGHECLLASVSADGDPSNIDPGSSLPTADGPIPHWRLVPFDNNIAQRNVAPVPGGGGGLSLADAFARRRFVARNTHARAARVELVPTLPAFLRRRGWELRFENPGGSRFTLGPRAEREIVLTLVPGQDFGPADVPRGGGGAEIEVETLVDGIPVGGMTYAIDPRLERPPIEIAGERPEDCTVPARQLLECLNVPAEKVASVRIKRVTVDIDLDKEDC